MNLYICHTAYQVLVDLLRAGRAPDGPHTMVLSTAVADAPRWRPGWMLPARCAPCWWTRPAGPAL